MTSRDLRRLSTHTGKVLSEEYLENGIAVTALVDKLHKYEYEEFVI